MDGVIGFEKGVFTVKTPRGHDIYDVPGRKWHAPTQTWVIPNTIGAIRELDRLFTYQWTPQARQAAVDTRNFVAQGKENITLTSAITLPESVTFEYPSVFKPFGHQQVATYLACKNHAFGNFDDMGTGKSKATIDALFYLHHNEPYLQGVVIACPNSVKGNWANEEWGQLVTHWPEAVPNYVLQYESGKSMSVLERMVNHKLSGGCMPFTAIVINYEALRSPAVCTALAALMDTGPFALVADESSRIKNRSAQQTKAMMELGKHAVRRYALSGTPITKDPLDLYSQLNFLDQRILGEENFFTFRNRYAVMGGYGGHQVIQWKDLDGLTTKIQRHSVRRLKGDCLDLPARLYPPPREIPMGKEQAAHYLSMKHEMLTTLGEDVVQANIVLVQFLRLQQILAGHLPIGEDKVAPIPDGGGKINEVMDILEETGEKVVVWCRFRYEIIALSARLADAGIGHHVFYGETKMADRDKAIHAFQNDKKCRVFVGQVATGGIGITLTAGTLVIYMTNDFSLEVRDQSESRCHRVGQKHNVTYIDLCHVLPGGKKTLDHSVMKILREKQKLAAYVIDGTWKDLI